jgi:hypothetical protein
MAAMHEQVHERARQDHKKRQGRSDMLLMPDGEVATDNHSNHKEDHTFRSSEATEHHQDSFFFAAELQFTRNTSLFGLPLLSNRCIDLYPEAIHGRWDMIMPPHKQT